MQTPANGVRDLETRNCMPRLMKWIMFFTACGVAWLLAFGFIFLSGSTACEVAATCTRDRVIGVMILLMLPAQAALAAYLRSRERDGDW